MPAPRDRSGDAPTRSSPSSGATDARVEAGEEPLCEVREAGAEQDLWDHVVGGVELGRLDLRELAPERCGRVAPLASGWHAAGLLEDAGPVLRLTTAGRLWGTNLARGLLGAPGLLSDGDGAAARARPASTPTPTRTRNGA